MRKRLPTPFAPAADPLALVKEAFGAIEMDLAQCPPEWQEPQSGFAVYLEGSGVQRPTWSRSEAGELALCVQSIIAAREAVNARALQKVGRKILSMPRFFTVEFCPRCYELQIGSSSGSGSVKDGLCGQCPAVCPTLADHRSNQFCCDSCRSPMVVCWTSELDIPGGWDG